MGIPLFDGHCDTASLLSDHGHELFSNAGHIDLKRGMNFSPYAQFFAIYNDLQKVDDIEKAFEVKLSRFFSALDKYSDFITLCKNGKEASDAASKGRIAAFLSCEGAEQIGCSVEKLRTYHGIGLKAVNITWNHENLLSGSCVDNPAQGLTPLGKSFIKECNVLDIIVDVSHISERGFWDIIEISAKPIMASHSNSKTLCDHPRNLSDEQYRAIIENGGIVGINLYADFLGNNPDIDTVFSHIEHFLSLGGKKHLAVGADFDGCDILPKGIDGIQDIHKIYERLLRANYPQSLVDDIFYYNMLNMVS